MSRRPTITDTTTSGHLSAPRTRLKPIVAATHLVVLSSILILSGWTPDSYAQTASTSATAVTKHYDIAPGALSVVLTRFSAAAGIYLIGDSKYAEHKTSQGLQGNYTIENGFTALLAGTGLQAVRQPDGLYNLVPAAGTNRQGEAVLPAVTVQASATNGITTEGTGAYTSGAMQTATKLALSVRETPQSVTVVTRQQFDDKRLTNMDELVRSTAGLSEVKDGPERSDIYARGFQLGSVMYDGLPSTSAGYLIPAADLAMYDHAEVVRGATGLMQGAGTPSASLNLVRKRPTKETHIGFTASAGSWQHYRGELDISGALNESGTLRARAVVAEMDKDSFQDHVQNRASTYYVIGEADLTNHTTLAIGASYQKNDNRSTYGGLPSAVDGSDLGLPRSTSLVNDWEYANKQTNNVFLELTHQFGNGWKVQAKAENAKAKFNMLGTYLEVVSASQIRQNVGKWDYELDQESYDIYASGPFSLLGRQHELVFGASHRKAKRLSEGDQGAATATSIDIINWNPYGIAEPNVPSLYNFGEDVRQTGIYSTARLNITDALKFIVGARLDWYDNQDAYSTAKYNVNGHLTRYAGIIYDLNKQHSVYASYTDIFQPQNQKNVSGGFITPMLGQNYEIGLKSDYLDGALTTNAALFVINQKNRALALQDQSSCPFYPGESCYGTSGLVRSQGIDLEVAGAILPNWRLSASYTYAHAEYKEDANQARIGQRVNTNLPESLFKLGTVYQFTGALEQWRIGGNITAQSGIWNQGTNYRQEQQRYALLDLMAGVQISKHVDLQLNINNVLDKVYYKAISGNPRWDNVRLYGEPRSFQLTMRTKF